MKITRAHRDRALKQLSSWRKEGVPLVVTAHEAYRLSNGISGQKDDHETPYPLARLALEVQA